MAETYYLGLMSGTSLDAIDSAIIAIDADNPSARTPRLVHAESMPWPDNTRERLRRLIEHSDSLQEMNELDHICGRQMAKAAVECINHGSMRCEQIAAIGCHGQTIRHSPNTHPPYTLQIGNPAVITEITGITTVSDFRSRDIAAGGQGAPFAPAFHDFVFHQDDIARVVVNIGGIANITILDGGPVRGFDTGPGNRLMDDWMLRQFGKPYDQDGATARQGEVNKSLLEALLQDSYFRLEPPKSTGTDYFNLAWLDILLGKLPEIRAVDILCTLNYLSARSISNDILRHVPGCQQVIICGGGAGNALLMEQIQQHLPGKTVLSSEQFGIHPDWVEAMAFAWLAQRTMAGLPGNLPDVTGARGPRVCGLICPA